MTLGGPSSPEIVDTFTGDETLLVYGEDSVDRLGRSVAAGDLNGDGLADLAIGAAGGDGPDNSTEDAGEVYIIFGRPRVSGVLDLARQSADAIVPGLDPNDALGANAFGRLSLLIVDMDGDGLDDLVVSALGGDGPHDDRMDAGEAYILFARR